MKNLISLLVITCLMLTLVGCGGEKVKETKNINVADSQHSIVTAKNLINEAKTLYSDLQNTYQQQKKDFNPDEWVKYSRSFRNKTKDFKKKVRNSNVNKDVKFNLGAVIGCIIQAQAEYGKDLQDKGSPEFIKDIDELLNKHLKKAEEAAKE